MEVKYQLEDLKRVRRRREGHPCWVVLEQVEDWKIPRWQSYREQWESVREGEWGVGLSGKNIEKKGPLRPL